jgi:serine/threonine-protein kinase
VPTTAGTLSSEFNLVRRLGEGWAGETWLAQLRRPRFGLPVGAEVAVKKYKPAIFRSALNIAERIHREATLGAKVNHENLVRVYELDKLKDDDGAEVWALTMQLCSGGDLRGFAKGRYPFAGGEILRIARGIGGGLAALHDAGVTHRDIKPDNILVDDAGIPKIGDFGVIRHLDEATVTGSAEFLGTIRYSAPEVLKADGSTQASDVYSLGTVLYELLYGERPYSGQEMFSAVIGSILAAPPVMRTSPDRFGADLSKEHLAIEAVCARLLGADAEQRRRLDR